MLDPLNEFLDRAKKGDGQFAIAAALWRCSDMLDRIGFNSGGDSSAPGNLEHIAVSLRTIADEGLSIRSTNDD